MIQINFYQAATELFDKTIYQIIEKCYQSKAKALVLFTEVDMQEQFNKNLWTYSQKKFIPHGSDQDPFPDKQPIYLTTILENRNDSTVVVLLNPVEKNLITLTQLAHSDRQVTHNFEKIIIIFDDIDKTILAGVSNFKTHLISQNISFDFFIQDAKGAWTKSN